MKDVEVIEGQAADLAGGEGAKQGKGISKS